MNIQELRSKTIKELTKERNELLREQFNLRINQASGQTTRPHAFKAVRRNIARVNTLINEKVRQS